MTLPHRVGRREDWLAERMALLADEKELTRRSDDLAQRRRELPWVRVDKDYQFASLDSFLSLDDLFQGRSQLLIYHFMFGPDYKAGCPSCSFIADGFNGFWRHLANHDVMLTAVSRAPIEKLLDYRSRMAWDFPWVSSSTSDFNADFGVGFSPDEQRTGFEYNYARNPGLPDDMAARTTGHAAACGVDMATYIREMPGMSAFFKSEGELFHTYSTYGRGLDILWGAYQWLDRAPLGRNEENGQWWLRHDEYPSADKQ